MMVANAVLDRPYRPYRAALKLRSSARDDYSAHIAHRAFARMMRPGDVVIEYGCADGHHLEQQKAGRKIGVEPNPVLRRSAHAVGFPIYASMAEIGPETADLVVSTYDLNYAGQPLGLLQQFNDKLTPGGHALLILCDESHGLTEDAEIQDEESAHWTAADAPRLLRAAGFEIVAQHVLPWRRIPLHRVVAAIFGWSAVCHLARFFHYMYPGERPVAILARKIA